MSALNLNFTILNQACLAVIASNHLFSWWCTFLRRCWRNGAL